MLLDVRTRLLFFVGLAGIEILLEGKCGGEVGLPVALEVGHDRGETGLLQLLGLPLGYSLILFGH